MKITRENLDAEEKTMDDPHARRFVLNDIEELMTEEQLKSVRAVSKPRQVSTSLGVPEKK